MNRNFDAKRRIAQMAARQIIDNQSVVFDSGSTLLQVAMQMPPVNNVVVATTAMNIAQHLMYRPGLDVHMIGGRVFPSTVSTIVSDSDKAVGGLVAHQAFLSAHAIDHAFDVVDVSEDIARTKRNLVRMARRVILVADLQQVGYWRLVQGIFAFAGRSDHHRHRHAAWDLQSAGQAGGRSALCVEAAAVALPIVLYVTKILRMRHCQATSAVREPSH